MKRYEFDKLTSLPDKFLFYGDTFFLSYYEKTVLKEIEGENVLKLYFDEYDYEEAKTHLSQPSLFGGENILFIKTDKIDKQLKNLINADQGKIYLFFYGVKPDTKPFKKNFMRFFTPNLKELIVIAQEYVSLHNAKLSNEMLVYLIKAIDYRFLFSELDKILIFDDITYSLIDSLVSSQKENSFDELFDSLFLKESFMDKLFFLLEKGEDSARILQSLIYYVRNIYLFNLFIKTTGNHRLKEVLGYQMPFDLEKKRVAIAHTLKESDFLELFDLLTQTDLKLKNSYDKESLLFSTLFSIKSLTQK